MHASRALATVDYVIIGVHVLLSAAVGMKAAAQGAARASSSSSGGASTAKQDSENYFLAGRSQPGWMIAVSLLSGLMSGISYLGSPGFAYSDGVGVMLGYCTVSLLTAPVAAFVIMPFFRNLELTTSYTYLMLRFGQTISTVTSVIFVLKTVVYLGMVLYAPALAISTLTSIPMWTSILVTSFLATIYTIKGGMLAVIWTDFIQSVVMIVVLFIAFFIALKKTDGFASVWDILKENGRLVDSSFFVPFAQQPGSIPAESYWSIALGTTVTNLAQVSMDQIAVQRFLTTKDVAESQRSIMLYCAINFFSNIAVFGLGVCMYAFYMKRRPYVDPLTALDGDTDKIFPYFVLNELPHGVPGLLLAAVLGSTMSVFAGGLNSAATSTYVDVIDRALGRGGPDVVVPWTRALTAIYGVTAVGFAFTASLLGGLVQMAVSLMGVSLGPIFGVFMLGILVERANHNGALIGLVGSFALTLYLAVAGKVCTDKLVVCAPWSRVGRLSFFWYGAVGFLLSIGIGAAASLCFPPPPLHRTHGLTWGTRHLAKAALARQRAGLAEPTQRALDGAASDAGDYDSAEPQYEYDDEPEERRALLIQQADGPAANTGY